MAALVPTTDRQFVLLHDLDDGSFSQDGDLVHVLQTTAVVNPDGSVTITSPGGTPVTTAPTAAADTDTIVTAIDITAGVLTVSRTDVDGTALPDLTATLPADTDTIPSALAFDGATNMLSLERTDVDGTALADLTVDLSALTTQIDDTVVANGSPVQVTGDDATGWLVDYDASTTPSTTVALEAVGAPYRAVVESPTDGKEYLLRSGSLIDDVNDMYSIWRENHDGTLSIDMRIIVNTLDTVVEIPLPVTLSDVITPRNTYVTLTNYAFANATDGDVITIPSTLGRAANTLSWGLIAGSNNSFGVMAVSVTNNGVMEAPGTISVNFRTMLRLA